RAGEVRIELDCDRLQGSSRRGTGHNEWRENGLSILQYDARRPAILSKHSRATAAAHIDTLHPVQRLRHVRLHRTKHSRGAAGVMMQEVERCPTGAGTVLQVPDAQRAEDALQGVVLEPVVQ